MAENDEKRRQGFTDHAPDVAGSPIDAPHTTRDEAYERAQRRMLAAGLDDMDRRSSVYARLAGQ